MILPRPLRLLVWAVALMRLSMSAARPGASVSLRPQASDLRAYYRVMLSMVNCSDNAASDQFDTMLHTTIPMLRREFPKERDKINLFEQAINYRLGRLDLPTLQMTLKRVADRQMDDDVAELVRLFDEDQPSEATEHGVLRVYSTARR